MGRRTSDYSERTKGLKAPAAPFSLGHCKPEKHGRGKTAAAPEVWLYAGKPRRYVLADRLIVVHANDGDVARRVESLQRRGGKDAFGHDVESSVFTICDFNHKGREINLKGLLRANENKEVIAVKRAYYAVQNVAAVFDDTLVRVSDSGFGTKDSTVCTYEYAKADGVRVFVFWTCANTTRWVDKKENPLLPDGRMMPVCERPGNGFVTRPCVFNWNGKPLNDPVWVDLLTGRIYEFPRSRQLVHSSGVTFVNVPVYDSPCLLAERPVVMK